MLQRIRVPIICNMLWALLVSFIFKFFNLSPIPSRVHTLLGSSLGLLLVFRTNTSYGRYCTFFVIPNCYIHPRSIYPTLPEQTHERT